MQISPKLQQVLCREEAIVHNTGSSLLLSPSVWVLLSPPRDKINGLMSLSMDGVAKEGARA